LLFQPQKTEFLSPEEQALARFPKLAYNEFFESGIENGKAPLGFRAKAERT